MKRSLLDWCLFKSDFFFSIFMSKFSIPTPICISFFSVECESNSHFNSHWILLNCWSRFSIFSPSICSPFPLNVNSIQLNLNPIFLVDIQCFLHQYASPFFNWIFKIAFYAPLLGKKKNFNSQDHIHEQIFNTFSTNLHPIYFEFNWILSNCWIWSN